MTPIAYHFPLIPKARTLNSRGASKQAAIYQNRQTQEAKAYAYGLILEQRDGRPPAMIELADMAIAFICPTNHVIDLMALGERVKPYIDALCPQYENINGERVLVAEGDIMDDRRQVIPNISLSATYRKGESGVTITLAPQ